MKSKNISFYIIAFMPILFILTSCGSIMKNNCDDAKSYADEAYSYFKKAYNADDLEDAQNYAKKGMSSATSAENAASESNCKCKDAESTASDAYSYGKKAYNSDILEDAQDYSKKAMSAASDISSYADDCEK